MEKPNGPPAASAGQAPGAACCSPGAPSCELKDPVCGMTVTAQSRHVHRIRRQARVFLQCRLQGEVCGGPCQVPRAVCDRRSRKHVHGVERSDDRRAIGKRNPLHLPDAPADTAGPSRRLSDLRHGPRAGDAEPRRRGEPRAGRLPAALLVDPAADRRRRRARHARLAPAPVRHGDPELGRAGAVGAGRSLGRMAVFRPWRSVGRQPQSQHVDADRPGHVRGLSLQRGRHRRTWRVSRLVRVDGTCFRLLRGGCRDHLPHPARPAARAQGALTDLGGDQVAARPGAEDGAAHRRRRHRRRRAVDACPHRRFAACASGRESARRRRCGRGQQLGR